jgi:hypothetical protein
MGDRSTAYKALVGKPEGKRPLERPRRRCENNINKEIVDWIYLLKTATDGRRL